MVKHSVLVTLCVWLSFGTVKVAADPPEIAGQWYGTFNAGFPIGRWASPEFPTGGIFEMRVLADQSGQLEAVLYIADLGFLDVPAPMAVLGNQVVIGNPQFAFGALNGDFMAGVAYVPNPLIPNTLLVVQWQALKEIAASPDSPSTGPDNGLPPLYCAEDAVHCSALLPFEPVSGPGFFDYLVKDETWDNQYRSHLRRDLRQVVQYAAAKVVSRTADWDYGNFAPLGLGDMSDANGQAPATNGIPDHITHEDGNHIDIAYYQLYAPDNLLRPVGRNQGGYLTESPYALDRWRTALFLVYLSEHPHLNYIAVDEEVGLLLEEAFLELQSLGWIDDGARARVPLVYGAGVTAGHDDHLHVAMDVLHPIVMAARLTPDPLNKSGGDGYVTAQLDFADGVDVSDIDASSIGLIVNGHTLVYAKRSAVDGSRVTAKFDGVAVRRAAGVGTAEMAIIGAVDGRSFQASDTIRVVSRVR